jgi:hypothetical protein
MQQSFVVPYLRSSPIHLPRRDLVLAAADSVLLSVSIIESDDPAAEALVITGGIGGPTLRMTVWPDNIGYYRDYGMWLPVMSSVLWSGTGTVDADTVGTFDLLIPVATMACWPPRCIYALQLDWSGATRSETLAQGSLHVRLTASPAGPFVAPALLTDDRIPVLEDDTTPVLA